MMTFSAKSCFFLFLALAVARLSAQNGPMARSILSSSMVVAGEETYLTLITQGINIIDWPQAPPKIAPLALKQDSKELIQIDGFIRPAYRYRIIAFQPGTYEIPPFRFQTPAGVVTSESHVLRVFPVETLSTFGIKPEREVSPYLTGVFLEKKQPFVGEQQNAEAKLYLSQAAPNRLSLIDGKVILFEKDGLAAWRFTTVPRETGFLDYENQRFRVYTYRSSLNALREGPLTLGPGEAPAIFSYQTREIISPIQFPAVNLEARPLPDGAPEGFEGAVGHFSMTVTPLNGDLEWGDALTVEVEVTGTGNIDKFPGPKLQDPSEQWKQFEMIAKPSGEERRSSAGTARFSQLVRPLSEVDALPPYRFVFFDPLVEQYRTLESPSTPLVIKGGPNTSSGTDGKFPFITPGQFPLRDFTAPSPGRLWWWQIIPSLMALVLVMLELRRRLAIRQLAEEPARKLKAAIQAVSAQAEDRVEFYREASRVATRWRGGCEFEELHQTRDEICFQPNRKHEPVGEEEKKHILNLLKSLTPLVLVAASFFASTQNVEALPDDPELAKQETLASMELSPDAGHFYNLAICEKALNNPGQAALWAYRFKLHGGDAEDLLKNLPGTREKEKQWPAGLIAIFPREGHFQIIMAGIWSFILLVGLSLTRQNQTPVWVRACLSIFGALSLLVGSASWFWYPDEISYEPLQSLAVVTGESPIRSEPFDGAEAIRDTPVGSLCKIASTRGDWSRVILPGGPTGWIRNPEVKAICPKAQATN